METGEAAPRLVPGAMAAICAAYRMKVPALAARAPLGATKTATGTGEARIALITSRIEVSSPPGVSICRITSSAPSLAARSMLRFAKCALAGPMAPSSGTRITGAADATAQAQLRTAKKIARIAADYAPLRLRGPALSTCRGAARFVAPRWRRRTGGRTDPGHRRRGARPGAWRGSADRESGCAGPDRAADRGDTWRAPRGLT